MMFTNRPGPSGYTYVETCTIPPQPIRDEISVHVDGYYYRSVKTIETTNGQQISCSGEHSYGRAYGFLMKLPVLTKGLEMIHSQAAAQLKNFDNNREISFSVIMDESNPQAKRINQLIKIKYYEQVSPTNPHEDFALEIAKAVTEKRNPTYTIHLQDFGIETLSIAAERDPNFSENLKQQLTKLHSPQTNIEVVKVQTSDYPQFKVPYGCLLFKVKIGEVEVFFDLGQHDIIPVKIYTPTQV